MANLDRRDVTRAAATPQVSGLPGVVFRHADAQLYAAKGSDPYRFSISG